MMGLLKELSVYKAMDQDYAAPRPRQRLKPTTSVVDGAGR
jgi:hypothetical protein